MLTLMGAWETMSVPETRSEVLSLEYRLPISLVDGVHAYLEIVLAENEVVQRSVHHGSAHIDAVALHYPAERYGSYLGQSPAYVRDETDLVSMDGKVHAHGGKQYVLHHDGLVYPHFGEYVVVYAALLYRQTRGNAHYRTYLGREYARLEHLAQKPVEHVAACVGIGYETVRYGKRKHRFFRHFPYHCRGLRSHRAHAPELGVAVVSDLGRFA